MNAMRRLFDLVWTVILALLGFILFGVLGAFMGVVIGILSGIAAEVRRGNDARCARRPGEETPIIDRILDWLDRRTGGRLSGEDRSEE